jgi:hypothetical protein
MDKNEVEFRLTLAGSSKVGMLVNAVAQVVCSIRDYDVALAQSGRAPTPEDYEYVITRVRALAMASIAIPRVCDAGPGAFEAELDTEGDVHMRKLGEVDEMRLREVAAAEKGEQVSGPVGAPLDEIIRRLNAKH